MSIASRKILLNTIKSNPSRFKSLPELDLELGLESPKVGEVRTSRSRDILKETIQANPDKFKGISDFSFERKTIVPEVTEEKAPKGFLSTIKNIFGDIKRGLKRTPEAVGVDALNIVSSTADFALDMVANFVEREIREPLSRKPLAGKEQFGEFVFDEKAANERADKWISFYEKTLGKGTEKAKEFTQELRKKESLKPTDRWASATLREKFSAEHIAETVFQVGPGAVASMGAFAISMPVGFVVSAGSVADDVKTAALEAGVNKNAADNLGLGAGLLIAVVDKVVPDELFGPREKGAFMKGFARRLIKLGLIGGKEAGTEVLQENIQIAVESTFRDDIGFDEVATRNAMAGLGGLLGGAGAQMTVNFVNQIRTGDIGNVQNKQEVANNIARSEGVDIEARDAAITKERQDTLIAIAKDDDAHKLVTAEDFASIRFGTSPDTQIGVIEADRIVPRDPVDVESARFKALEKDILENGFKEPVVLTVLEDGTIETFDGSHRTVVGQRNQLGVPVLVTSGTIEGLGTVEDLYETVKEAPSIKDAEVGRDSIIEVELEKLKKGSIHKRDLQDTNVMMPDGSLRRTQLSHELLFKEFDLEDSGIVRVSTSSKDAGAKEINFEFLMEPTRKQLDRINTIDSKTDWIVNVDGEGIGGEFFTNSKSLKGSPIVELTGRKVTKTGLEGLEKPKPVSKKELEKKKSVPKKKVKVEAKKPKVIKVPATQLPVGEGKEKISRLEARVKGKLDLLKSGDVQKAKEVFGLTTYNQLNRAAQREMVSAWVAENTDDAMRVLQGEIDPPKGFLKSAIYVTLKELGVGDTELAVKLSTLMATRAGQEINFLQELDADNPVTMMEGIVKTKIEAFEKRTGKKADKKVKEEIKKIDKELKVPDKAQWEVFLESIKC